MTDNNVAPAAAAADSAIAAFPEFEMPVVESEQKETPAPTPEVDPSKPAAAPDAPVKPEEPKKEPKEEPKEEPKDESKDTPAEKRIKDAQNKMHQAIKEGKELKLKLKKASEALLQQVESAGITFTDEEQQLAFDNPAELARLYVERLEAKKQEVERQVELTEDEKAEIEKEHKEQEEKSQEELVVTAWIEVKTEMPDIESVITEANIEKYFTGADHKEIREIENPRDRFVAGYKKMKAYLDGVEAAKQKMQEGPATPGPSLSEAGSAVPGAEAAHISIEEAWSSNKL